AYLRKSTTRSGRTGVVNTRKLGPDGPAVSEVGIGCMYLSIRSTGSAAGRPSEAEAVNALRAALDAGCTFFDTANVYCFDDGDLGHNEHLLRKALDGRSDRAKVVVATKGGLGRPGGAWTRRGRPEEIAKACIESLRALGTEAIDLYQLHAPDPAV